MAVLSEWELIFMVHFFSQKVKIKKDAWCLYNSCGLGMWCVDLCRVHYLFQDQEMAKLVHYHGIIVDMVENKDLFL